MSFFKLERKHITTLIMTVLLLSIFYFYEYRKTPQMTFNDGQLDVMEMDHLQTYELTGSWVYYPYKLPNDIKTYATIVDLTDTQQIIKTDEPITYGTFSFSIQNLDPERVYAIILPNIHGAHTLYINQLLVSSGGVFSIEIDLFQPTMGSETIYFSPDTSGHADFLLGIITKQYEIEPLSLLPIFGYSQVVNLYLGTQMVLISLLTGSLVALSLYFLIVYFLSRREQKAWTIGVFSLLIALKILFNQMLPIHFIDPNLSYHLMITLDFMVTMLIFPMIGLMVSFLGYSKRIKGFEYLMCSTILFVFITSLFFSPSMYFVLFDVYKVVVVFFSPYLVYYVIQGIKAKKANAIPFLITLLLLIGTTFNIFFFRGSDSYFVYAAILLIGLFVVSYADEFTSVKHQSKFLENQILTDPLTGVYNRLFLTQIVEQNTLNTQNHSDTLIFFIDLDAFKQTNDIYGHMIGDQILIILAQRMQSFFQNKAYTIRYGGDEFIVLFPFNHEQSADTLKSKLENALNQPIIIDHLSIMQTVTIGHALYHRNHHDLHEKIHMSDANMYTHKQKMSL